MAEDQVFNAFYEDSAGEDQATESERLPNGNFKCKHKCKTVCQHACCKEGVKPKSRARARRAVCRTSPRCRASINHVFLPSQQIAAPVAAKPDAFPLDVVSSKASAQERLLEAPTEYTDEGMQKIARSRDLELMLSPGFQTLTK